MQSFGLDIGATSIKAVELINNNGSYTLNAVVNAPSTQKGLLSESALDQQLLADTIKQVIESAQIKSKAVHLALPESQVYARIIDMPQLSEQELSAALKWEMEQYVPLPLDQVRTDYQILSRVETNNQKMMNVLLVAAPLALLEKYEKILTLAELSAESIETEMISVFRAVNPLVANPQASLIAHIGSTSTNVAVVGSSVLQVIFSIPVGGVAITRAISLDLGIDVSQAENFKKAYGLTQEAFQGKIGKSLFPVLGSITNDLKKAVIQFKEKNATTEIKQLVLSGGSALLPGIDVYLTNSLGIQVVTANAWQLYNVANVPDPVLAEAPSFTTAFGLALKGAHG